MPQITTKVDVQIFCTDGKIGLFIGLKTDDLQKSAVPQDTVNKILEKVADEAVDEITKKIVATTENIKSATRIKNHAANN
ncbi:MAG: hypothetical protein JKX85_04680 [Phycisphaeraceae bacterium]|nr:hypothetical protein [Phycisphaeraceae bacterium]